MIEIIILGIIQGLTEFLPISSSGHLAIVENYLGIEEPVALTAFLHFGTLMATIIFFRKEIISLICGLLKKESGALKYLWYIIIGNIPVVLFAILLRDFIESTFTEVKLVMIFLGMTGVIVLLTSIIKKGEKQISLLSAMLIGIGQMFAVFPGLSRSGLTISAGLYAKVKPEEAFRFSFLLSLPAIFGANLLEFREITNFYSPVAHISGMFISFVFGYIALKILRAAVQKWFHFFGFYCLLMSLLFLAFSI
ncbi:MAG: undecaprenyl-diphosphate phosphatase [candidate division WOR-3 bacterium]|nr:undecaprenyl-diphosphate phosphatase [candidate division WOR-3 bacterium]